MLIDFLLEIGSLFEDLSGFFFVQMQYSVDQSAADKLKEMCFN